MQGGRPAPRRSSGTRYTQPGPVGRTPHHDYRTGPAAQKSLRGAFPILNQRLSTVSMSKRLRGGGIVLVILLVFFFAQLTRVQVSNARVSSKRSRTSALSPRSCTHPVARFWISMAPGWPTLETHETSPSNPQSCASKCSLHKKLTQVPHPLPSTSPELRICWHLRFLVWMLTT